MTSEWAKVSGHGPGMEGESASLLAAACDMTRGKGHSSAAPRYPREALQILAHAEPGFSEQLRVCSSTQSLILPKSDHRSQTDPIMFQLDFIRETNELLSAVNKDKRQGG